MAITKTKTFVLLLFMFSLVPQTYPLEQFMFQGFNQTDLLQNLTLDGASMIQPNGALMLTNRSKQIIGHAFYSQPIQLFETNTSQSLNSPNMSSFSTCIVFQIIIPSSGRGGHGLAFTLSSSPRFPGAEPSHFLGIFNETNNGLSSNHIFAVEFDIVNNGYKDNSDSAGNHVGININSMASNSSEPAAYYKNATSAKEEFSLEGDPVQAWIEYDGTNKEINVTIAPATMEKPSKPLMQQSLDLSKIVESEVYVGFSASTGEKSSSHYVLGWSFSVNGQAQNLNFSLLPKMAPREEHSPSFTLQTEVLIAALSALVVLGSMFLVYRWRRRPEMLEDWELDCPHRFRYKDLHEATKGFKKSEVIGSGGFGVVYKGVLSSTKTEVAVKKIARHSIQGMREFVAEIESLGHLRHKHLVNLQGWCKQNDDLLLVYDYVPNGSLDSLLFKNNVPLTWEQRFNIVKGIAYGLLYLHEEWVKVVIHRDVKSSNVLIDSDMNARLGDFGLARLYDHDKNSHTTNVVGTIGYIAPELARTGKSSTSSDVFAYGVVLLEVATGKRPVLWDQYVLFEWVLQCHQAGRILDAADPDLGPGYEAEEMGLVLRLGMWCTHYRPDSRPNMRQVVRYLNGDDHLPELENWTNDESFELGFGAFEVVSVSGGSTSKSRPSSSIGGSISCNSIQNGR